MIISNVFDYIDFFQVFDPCVAFQMGFFFQVYVIKSKSIEVITIIFSMPFTCCDLIKIYHPDANYANSNLDHTNFKPYWAPKCLLQSPSIQFNTYSMACAL